MELQGRTLRSPNVTLPADAAGAIEISDPVSGTTARFSLPGAERSAISSAEGFAIYPNARAGADLLFRVDPHGVEDFLAFASRPSREAIDYALDVSGVAGLRQIGEILELVDPGGAPRLRVLPPALIDRRGASHRARLSIENCSVDRNARAPWGRPITPPGASACTLHVDWTKSGVEYPAILDPHWVATTDMAAPRADHTATLLNDGRVLVTGGGNNEASAELYDEGTGTWASTGAMTTPREGHSSTLLKNGKVLLASGGAGPLGFILSSELYDPATGTFTASGDENEMHGGAPGILLNDGTVLVAAGNNHFGTTDAAEIYDPATGQFNYTGSVVQSRGNYSAALLLDGTVLISGGEIALNPGEVDTAEIYDPATGQFSATGSLSNLRAGHSSTTLKDGKVLIAGGYNDPNVTTEIYDPASKTFSLGPDLASGQADHRALLMPDGTVVMAGGGDTAGFTKTAQLYDPAAGTVVKLDPMLSPRAEFTLTLLTTGNVLAAGGYDASGAVTPLFSAERLVAGTAKANGTSCTQASECTSGFCADGVCCESKCDGQCEACNQTGKAGLCEPVTGAPVAPRAACTGAGQTCGGQCDGTHHDACAFPPASTSCGSSCGDGMLTESHCDGSGSCAAGTPAACPDQLGCADTKSCATSCTTTADCAADHVCVSQACVSACDGNHTLTHADGSQADCAPYTCAAAACKTTCASNADCVAPATCSAGKCVAPGSDKNKAAASSEESSGCTLGPSRDAGKSALWPYALGLGLALWRRRRR